MSTLQQPAMVAIRASESIVRDARLGSAVWRRAPAYSLDIAADQAGTGRSIQEPGAVQLAWDPESLHIGFRFEDSDIVAEGSADGEVHNRLGDVCEVLLKPHDRTWYWELQATPAGHGSVFFFPGRGRLVLPGCLEHRPGLRVAVHLDGRLNDWREHDRGWSGHLAMPVSELTRLGDAFGPGSHWRILVARYNYSRFIDCRGPELSTSPQLGTADFHRQDEYARLEFA